MRSLPRVACGTGPVMQLISFLDVWAMRVFVCRIPKKKGNQGSVMECDRIAWESTPSLLELMRPAH